MYNTFNRASFYDQGHYSIKWYFQHLSTGKTYWTYDVFKNLSLNIKTSVLYDKNFILCFNLLVWWLQSYLFLKANGATPLSLRILMVNQCLGCFRGIFKVEVPVRDIFKTTKWSVNTSQRNEWILHLFINAFREISSYLFYQ